MGAIELLAQGGTGSPPAGGGDIGQVIGATVGATLITAAMFGLVLAHRSGRTDILRRLAGLAERQTGLPGWASLPLAVLTGSLLIAVFGMYWDIATHIDGGRDPGPLANASHYFILFGLFGIFFAGLVAIFLPDERPGPAALKVREGWYAPLGGALILLCSALALSAFPLDDVWHRIFGQDVTLWGPTHLVLFGGAALSVVGAAVLGVEGVHARGSRATGPEPGRTTNMRKVLRLGYAGAFLIALSTFQGEFDYAVPQFRLVMQPILLMLAASVALVAARVYLGRGAAFAAVGLFLIVRGALSLLVSPTFGHTGLHFPLYIVEAAVVELVALRVDTRRDPVRFGLIAGAGIGTIGLAAEWAWSHIWWTMQWNSSMLPEAVIAGLVTAVAGGVLGSLIGRALLTEPDDRAVPRWAGPAAGIAIVAVLVYAVPITEPDEPARAQVTLTEVSPPPEREVNATVRLTPRDAADDAHWFVSTGWQGEEGRSVVDPLERVGEGVYRTTKPLPVYGNWKVSLRLHKGAAVDAMPVYFPADRAIPVGGIPARESFSRPFIEDKKLLQREQKEGVSGALVVFAYLTVLLIACLLVASIAVALIRLRRTLVAAGTRRGERSDRSSAAGKPTEPVAS